MKQRKILMVLMGLDIGGAETHVIGLSTALQQLGCEVLVASAGGVYEKELEQQGIRHFRVSTAHRNLWDMFRAKKQLEKLILQERPDIVHAHARIPAFICGLLQKKYGFAFVTTAHWTFNVNPLLRSISNWGQQTIAVSEDIREYLIDNYHINSGNIHVTVNGIDTEQFQPGMGGEAVRKEFGIPQDAPVVVCVTRLHKTRALSAIELVGLAPELAKAFPGVRILIAGDGDMLEQLRSTARSTNAALGYSCLLLAGARTDIPQLLRAGTVFVGVSRAALEAMSCELPTILCGNEGHGGLVLPENAERLRSTNYCCRDYPASTQEMLLADLKQVLSLDSAGRQLLGKDGRNIVLKDFSLMTMAKDCERVYELVLSQRRRRVVVSGYYGYDNMGDDAILETVCRKYGGECELTVLSKSPQETAKRYPVGAVYRFSPWKVYRAIRESDALLSGGGSLLQDRTSSRSLWYYLWVLKMAQKAGKQVLVYANGVGPVSGRLNRKMTASVLKKLDCITVRDADSEAELRKMGVTGEIRVAADPVFDIPADEYTEAAVKMPELPKDRPLIGVFVRRMSKAGLQNCAAYIDRVCEATGAVPVMLCMQQSTDEKSARDLLAEMKTEGILAEGVDTIGAMLATIGQLRLVISMRLHALIFSAVMGTPCIGFASDPKVVSLVKQLDMPLLEIPENLNVEKSAALTIEMCGERENYAKRLRTSAAQQRSKAQENDLAFEQVILRRHIRKRLAFFQTNLRVGGIQKALMNSVFFLASKDCDIDIYLFDKEAFFDISQIPENVTIHYLKPFPYWTRFVPFHVIRCLAKPFGIPDYYDAAVDFDSYQQECAYGALSVRADRRIMWIHNDMEIKLREEPKYRILYWFMHGKYRSYTHFAAVSQGIIEPFRKCSGLPFAEVIAVPNPINTEEIRQKMYAEPPAEVDQSRFNIVSVGRLCHQKGYDLMLEDIRRVCNARKDVVCWLIGDGPDRESLQKQAEKLGISDHVIFTGNLPNPFPMLRRMDAFCLESRYEGQGIVFWEAKAIGLPLYFPKRLEKYNPALQGCEDVAEALIAAEKLDPETVDDRFDMLSGYNSELQMALCRVLGITEND